MDELLERAKRLRLEHPAVKRVALSYSGGLDSAVVGKLLSSAGFEVLPVAVNLGQQSDFSRIEKNAKSMFGSCRMVDARKRFAGNIFRAIKANFGSDGNLNSGGISRPVLAIELAEVAKKEGCQAIAHGSSGTGNEHLIMENSLRVLAPEMRIMAIVRDLDLRRDESLQFASKHRLATNLQRAKNYSADENLWGRTMKQGSAIDPSSPLPEDAYKWTVSPKKAPARSAEIEVEFIDGIPVSGTIGKKKITDQIVLITRLNEVGGANGIGRGDALDGKVVGLKARELYECPAAAILLAAHRELEAITLTTKELSTKRFVEEAWSRLVREGGWYTRLRRNLDAFIDESQRPVDGIVALELYKGSITVKSRKSRHALYDTRLSSRDSRGVFSQKETRQFAKLYGLQDVIAYMIDVD